MLGTSHLRVDSTRFEGQEVYSRKVGLISVALGPCFSTRKLPFFLVHWGGETEKLNYDADCS